MQGAQGYGTLGRGIAGLGQMGQGLLANQINLLNTLGGQGRGIQDAMYGAQYDAATGLAQEPIQRLSALANLISGMLPKTMGTGITTQYGNVSDQGTLIQDLINELFGGS